ncbi:MAG: SGNH/GDSL hydrolase family protein [Cytophagales bacterium]|nr:SGNH/GDSL hydrolase family protein [Cytophagales bacterium]
MLKIYLRYWLGVLLTIPLLPILYVQGKRVKANVPSLPEATGTDGLVRSNNAEETWKLLVIGESTMAGVGVKTHEEGFSGTLARELSQLMEKNIEWKVFAKSGYTAREVREKLIPSIDEATCPDLIVIGLGGNDSFTLNTPWGWKKQMSLLVEEIRNRFPNTAIMIGSLPPIKEFAAFTPLMKWVIGNLCEILGETLKVAVQNQSQVAYHHQVITFEQWKRNFNIEAKDEDFFSDGVHPSKLTYQTMARDMAHFINEQLP